MIKEFFVDETIVMKFKMFGLTHISLVLILFFSLYLLYLNSEKLIKIESSLKRKISLIFITIMFLNMSIYYLKLVYYLDYDWHVHLPLHFCFISGYLYMYAILFKKYDFYKTIYFFSFMGPLPAVLLPGLESTFDAFIFYQYFISHHFFLFASMFTFYAYDIYISKKDVLKAYTAAISIFIGMYIFNLIFGTNYIMQKQLPDHVIEIFPFLKNITNPFLMLILSGSIVFGIAYIPVYFKNKKSLLSN
jgi:hypothetical integral membrane protein (TIGR02206 family)